MKKIYVLLISALCALTFCACNSGKAHSEEEFSELELVQWGEGNRHIYYNLEEMENDSEIIVIGSFIGDAEQEEAYIYDSHFEKDVLSFVISKNNIEVLNVIKGNVEIGSSVTITQMYGVVDNQLVTDSKLTPMLSGDTWIFFLTENTGSRKGTYRCTGDNDGRYPVKNFSYGKNALTDNEDLGVYNKEDFREDIYNEILEKYDLS